MEFITNLLGSIAHYYALVFAIIFSWKGAFLFFAMWGYCSLILWQFIKAQDFAGLIWKYFAAFLCCQSYIVYWVIQTW